MNNCNAPLANFVNRALQMLSWWWWWWWTTKQLTKCNSLRKCFQLQFSATSKTLQLPVISQNEFLRIFMKLYTVNFENFYEYYTEVTNSESMFVVALQPVPVSRL